MALDAEGYRIYKGEPEGKLVQEAKYEEPVMTDTAPHIANFLAAVRSRKYQDLNADVDIGRISADLAIWPTSATGAAAAFDVRSENRKIRRFRSQRHRPSGLPQTLHHSPAHRVV